MSDLGLSQPDLIAPRLRLRRLQPSDAALLRLYASDPRVAKMTTTIPHPYPPGLAEAFVDRILARATTETVWAIDTGADAENGLIGLISLKRHRLGEGEIGYWVAPAFWGTGYASEAVDTVVRDATARGCDALTAQVFQDNPASARVLSRAGFGYIGEGEAYSVARGSMVPTFEYRRELRTAPPPQE